MDTLTDSLPSTDDLYREKRVPFTAGDGLELNLINVKGSQTPDKGPVLLCHGAGVRAEIFRPPVQTTIVDCLIQAGYDVWLENWRGSIDIKTNNWSLDQVALYDHPKAVEKVVEQTGADQIKAIIHCQGSTSFTMSAIAGLVPQVSTIVSNAVSLHPVVPNISLTKLKLAVPILKRLITYMDPQWAKNPQGVIPKLLYYFTRLTHHECDNDVCKMISFTYGTGWPTLWAHENLNERTHDWISDEFKKVPLRFFDQIKNCAKQGHLSSSEKLPGLPQDFTKTDIKTDARFAFFSGKNNRCFLSQSQINSYEFFKSRTQNKHSLHIIPNYGHLDIFLGKNAEKDVFPLILEQLAV